MASPAKLKKVLITGAGTGFGLEVAMRLTEKGFNVIAAVEVYGQVQTVKRRAAARGVELQVEKLDVTDDGDRGVAGANRARRFGLRSDPFAEANGEIAAIVQIETAAAVADVLAVERQIVTVQPNAARPWAGMSRSSSTTRASGRADRRSTSRQRTSAASSRSTSPGRCSSPRGSPSRWSGAGRDASSGSPPARG